jgi:hypothetical protein
MRRVLSNEFGFVYRRCWIVFVAVWAVGALLAKPAAHTQSTGSDLLHRRVFAAAVVLLSRIFHCLTGWICADSENEDRLVDRAIVNIAFAICARFYIGRNWNSRVTIKQNHELVRSGPYVFVRHPIYSGILPALAGTALTAGEMRRD